jgi:hypothetical protein
MTPMELLILDNPDIKELPFIVRKFTAMKDFAGEIHGRLDEYDDWEELAPDLKVWLDCMDTLSLDGIKDRDDLMVFLGKLIKLPPRPSKVAFLKRMLDKKESQQ